MPVELIDPIEDDVEDVVDQAPDAGEQKPAAQPQDNVALARQIGAEILGQLQSAPAQGGQKPSALQAAIKDMLDEGVPEIAIKRILKLREAERADEEALMTAKQQKAMIAQFDAECWQIGANELANYSKNIPILANAGDGLKTDLLNEISLLIQNDPEFASVRAQIAVGRHPDQRKVGQAAAKVVDAWLASNGISKTKPALNLQSSKPQAGEAKANLDEMSKGQKQIFAQVLKYTGDEKKAMKRALELAS